MKLFHIILISLILNCYSAFAESKFDWSTPQAVNNRTPDTKILGKLDNAYFVMRYNNSNPRRGIVLEKYNAQMRLNTKNEFVTSRNTNFVKTLLTNNSIIAIYYEFDRRDNKATYFAKLLNADLETIVIKEILELNAGNLQDAFDKLNISISKDRNSILVYFRNPNESEKINYYQFNTLFEIKYNGTFNLNISSKFNINQTEFNDDYLALLVNSNPISKNKPETILTLFKYSFKSKSLNQFPLNNDSLYASNGKIKIEHINNTLNFTGIYKNEKNNEMEGILLFRIYSDKPDSSNIKYLKFANHNIYIKDGGLLPRTSLNNFFINDVIFTNKGDFILIAENYETSQRIYQDFPAYGVSQSYVRYHYLYQEVLIVSFDNNFNIEWVQVIKKDQNSVNDKGVYSSFSHSILAREIKFIYNDLTRINWNILGNTVDLSGNLNRNLLISNNEFDGRLIPRQAVQVSPNETLIPGMLNRRGHVVLRISH